MGAGDVLLQDHGVYVQPINFPTVPEGTERFRLTAGPLHSDEMIYSLRDSLNTVWEQLDIPRTIPQCYENYNLGDFAPDMVDFAQIQHTYPFRNCRPAKPTFA